MKLKHSNTVIIVTGGPGTGKSYTAHKIAKIIDGIELLSYDRIKEEEWDRFGFDNACQKDRLNWFCLEEYYLTVQKKMWEGKTLLLEYPFYQRHREQLLALIEQYHYHAITILLYGDWSVIYRRGQNRDKGDYRHPGHLTNCYHKEKSIRPEDLIPDAMLTYEEFRADIDRKNYDIQLGSTIKVDVTDFKKVSFHNLFTQIERIDQAAI